MNAGCNYKSPWAAHAIVRGRASLACFHLRSDIWHRRRCKRFVSVDAAPGYIKRPRRQSNPRCQVRNALVVLVTDIAELELQSISQFWSDRSDHYSIQSDCHCGKVLVVCNKTSACNTASPLQYGFLDVQGILRALDSGLTAPALHAVSELAVVTFLRETVALRRHRAGAMA